MSTSTVLHAGVGEEPLSLEAVLRRVESEYCGAVVGFSGVVRNHDGGKAVERLSYSSHPSAARIILELAEDTARTHDGVRIWVAHRTGDLAIGDSALVAAVAAAHRGQAFTACSELVDMVKARVPIWKEQFFADGGTEWVGAGNAQ